MVRQPGLFDELLQLLHLAVGERIHRIDDDGARARRFSGGARPNRCIDDRHEEAERLARAGSGRHREALPLGGLGDGLRLVAVKSDRLPVDTEYARRVRMQRSVGRQIRDRCAALEIRIDADERFGPEAIRRVDLLDLRDGCPAPESGEGTSKALVVAYERAI